MPADANNDKRGIGQCTEQAHGEDMAAFQPDTEHKRILGADRQDQRQAQEKPVDEIHDISLFRSSAFFRSPAFFRSSAFFQIT